MNEWTAATPIVITTEPDPPAPPARPRVDLRQVRRWPRWQQALVVTLTWAGAWTLLTVAACRALGVRPDAYVALLLAGCAVVFALITAIAWRTGRLVS